MPDRRDPRRQRPLPGGKRQTDPPLNTARCAEVLGCSTEYIRRAITEGVPVPGSRVLVKLQANSLPNKRREWRIYRHDLVVFLRAIQWSRIPLWLLRPIEPLEPPEPIENHAR